MSNLSGNKRNISLKVVGLLIMVFLINQSVAAHDVVGELEKMSSTDAAILYGQLGFSHIIPLGFDHIFLRLARRCFQVPHT